MPVVQKIYVRDFQKGNIFSAGENIYGVVQVAPLRLRNLRTWEVVAEKFSPNDAFDRVEIERRPARFMYGGDGVYIFCDAERPVIRFSLTDVEIGDRSQFLTMGTEVELLTWSGKIINISLPNEA